MSIFGGKGKPNDEFIMRVARAKGNMKAPVKPDGGKGMATKHHTAAAVRKDSPRVKMGAVTAKRGLK